MSIYIATGKDIPDINKDIFKKIIVGGALKYKDKQFENGCIFDNYLNNISLKNPYYCELTALYWMWKNAKENIYGLAHYRRYLWINNIDDSYVLKCFDDVKEAIDYISVNDESLLLEEYDIILPKKQFLKETVLHEYSRNHYADDIDIISKIINDKFPDYNEDMTSVFNSCELYLCNMFITKKEFFERYMKWLFDILFEAEKYIDVSNRDKYQQRVFGFLAERLFNVFIHHNQMKIREVPMIFIKKNSDSVCDQFDDWKYKIKKKNLFYIRDIISLLCKLENQAD